MLRLIKIVDVSP